MGGTLKGLKNVKHNQPTNFLLLYYKYAISNFLWPPLIQKTKDWSLSELVMGQAGRLDSNSTGLDPLWLGFLSKLEIAEPTKFEIWPDVLDFGVSKYDLFLTMTYNSQ